MTRENPKPPQHRLTAQMVGAWLRLSDDHNPLHADAVFARAHGFADPVVPGTLLAALTCDALQADKHGTLGPRRLRMRFRSPVPVGAQMTIHIQGPRLRVTHTGSDDAEPVDVRVNEPGDKDTGR